MYFKAEGRILKEAEYIVKNKATVRETAKQFGVCKETVHKDMTKKLKWIDEKLAIEVRRVLDLNKDERYSRGGQATKRKYSKKSEK